MPPAQEKDGRRLVASNTDEQRRAGQVGLGFRANGPSGSASGFAGRQQPSQQPPAPPQKSKGGLSNLGRFAGGVAARKLKR